MGVETNIFASGDQEKEGSVMTEKDYRKEQGERERQMSKRLMNAVRELKLKGIKPTVKAVVDLLERRS